MDVPWNVFSGPVRNALRDLDRCDRDLLAFKAHERPVTHKLAEYLRHYLDPHFGQAPGPVCRTSGSIGQVHSRVSKAEGA